MFKFRLTIIIQYYQLHFLLRLLNYFLAFSLDYPCGYRKLTNLNTLYMVNIVNIELIKITHPV